MTVLVRAEWDEAGKHFVATQATIKGLGLLVGPTRAEFNKILWDHSSGEEIVLVQYADDVSVLTPKNGGIAKVHFSPAVV